METKPLTTEDIALTEKKMDMTLDDIIKMTKKNVVKPKQQRILNKNQNFTKNAALEKSAKVQRFMNTSSYLRQGALDQKRSNFQGNQFPLATAAARKAEVAPYNNRAFNRGWGVNMNQMRAAGPPVQRQTGNGRFTMKPQDNLVLVGRPQTLDSRFAHLKEQRMMIFSQQNYNYGVQQNFGGPQRQQQWRRSRYGNY